jgi:predicted glycosyltransferase
MTDDVIITFQDDDKVKKFVDALELKEGNLYIVLKPEENGFEILGADKLPGDVEEGAATNMYILFAGLMHIATEQQDLVMEAGNYAIHKELVRKKKKEVEGKGENIIAFPGQKDV